MKNDIKFGRHEKTHHKKSDERKEFEKLEKIAEDVFDYIQGHEDCMKMDKQSFCTGFMNCYSFLCPISIDAAKIKVKMILNEGQRGLFEGKQRILDEITPATKTETKLKNLAQFILDQFRLLQIADNKRNAERNAEKERPKEILSRNSNRCSKAMGAMVACYRAIDRHFGNEIRAQLEKNDRTQNE